MTNPSRGADTRASDPPGIRTPSPPASRVRPYALDIVPIGPNVFATLSGFFVLLFAPWACVFTLQAIREEAIGDDPFATYLMLAGPEQMLAHAVVGAALFLVIGVILQAWDYIRPFPARLPIALAFPVAWVMLLPEALLAGASALSGVVVAAAIAIAFAVHWGMVTFLDDLRD